MLTTFSSIRQLYLKSKLQSANYSNIETLGILGYAPHKTASMFIAKLFRDLANEKRMLFFSDNNSPSNVQELTPEVADSFCLAPIRSLQKAENGFQNIGRVKKIIQIRDSRDIVVSEYYSLAFSHPDKGWSEKKKRAREAAKQMTIDDYVSCRFGAKSLGFLRLSRFSLEDRFLVFLPELANGALIVKYEDMVLNYRSWLKPIVNAFEFGSTSDTAYQYYFLKYKREFEIPKTENVCSHKRAIKPGDHRDKLSYKTINHLNEVFSGFLNQYGYEL